MPNHMWGPLNGIYVVLLGGGIRSSPWSISWENGSRFAQTPRLYRPFLIYYSWPYNMNMFCQSDFLLISFLLMTERNRITKEKLEIYKRLYINKNKKFRSLPWMNCFKKKLFPEWTLKSIVLFHSQKLSWNFSSTFWGNILFWSFSFSKKNFLQEFTHFEKKNQNISTSKSSEEFEYVSIWISFTIYKRQRGARQKIKENWWHHPKKWQSFTVAATTTETDKISKLKLTAIETPTSTTALATVYPCGWMWTMDVQLEWWCL